MVRCLCTINLIIIGNQINVCVAVDVDIFNIRNRDISFGISNGWFRNVCTAAGTVIRIAASRCVRCIAGFNPQKLFIAVQTFCLRGSGGDDVILFHINGRIKFHKAAGVL